MLVEATGFRYRLRYSEMGFPGTSPRPFLHPRVLERLHHATAHLPPAHELLIWDAFRTPAAQRHLYQVTIDQFRARGMTDDQAREAVKGFVANPDGVFPHGTGGAIDLTLVRDGQELPMGTDFDDFSPMAARDWYRENPVTRELDPDAALHREILFDAMEAAGFVGLDSEWWHFEYGTARWGRVTDEEPFLTSVLSLDDSSKG